MGEYEIYTHLEVLHALPRNRAQREKIFQFLDLLSRFPYTPRDFKEKDITLREHEVKIVGDFEINYWFDAPVKTVMIVSLRPADS